MSDFALLGSARRRSLLLGILTAALFLTLAAANYYATPLDGIPDPAVRQLDSGWFCADGGSLTPLEALPCRLARTGNTLRLVHSLADLSWNPGDVLAIQTRYQSIQVWADQTLIYEAALGQDHALSNMWHFIPVDAYAGSSSIEIELTSYDTENEWELLPILQDHPAAIRMYLLQTHLPTILMWMFCMLFSLLLLIIVGVMMVRRVTGAPLVLSLAAFIFLSGSWILLDSKVTTLAGGNYALTYFFSYCIFYLLPLPLLFYFQLMLERKNRLLMWLIWITAGNAGLWMLLHLLHITQIRNTTVSVHLIILTFLITFIWECLKNRKNRPQKRLMYTFYGMALIFIAALISIILYYAELLPPTNSAVLYVWGLLSLILCMVLDLIAQFGHIWKERQYAGFYRQLATEDSMTALKNRNAYELRLQEILRHPSGPLSMILFDIDRMKYINDTYGHHAGDQAIALTAKCIREVFGGSGDCYRIGGDEFCVIQAVSETIPRQLRQFDTLIQSYSENPFPLTVSHGWETQSIAEGTDVTMDDLIGWKTAADQDLYRSKAAWAASAADQAGSR